jgi:ribosomal protein S18 acetylase RimI-like enzyme
MGACEQRSGRIARIARVEIRPARWSDIEEVAELIGVQNRAAVGAAGVRVGQVRNDWEATGFRVGLDNLVAEDGGLLVGYGALTPEGALVLAALDDPIADALLACVFERAQERGDGCVRVKVAATGSDLERLVRRHPFRLERETLLMRRALDEPVSQPAVPAGLAIRTFEPSDAASVRALLNAAYGAWDESYVPLDHEVWVAWMTGDSEFDASVWWLAERCGVLVGCALHWGSGWLKDLAVIDAERGRGLGATLVQFGLAEFTTRGLRRVGLKVDGSNPTGAIRLYERLGFVTESSEAVWASTL